MNLPHAAPPRDYPDGQPHDRQARWRQDFPVDTPEDDLVARREFTKFMVLTSGAFVVGQCWIGLASSAGSRGPRLGVPGTPRTRIAAAAEVKVGSVTEFRYPSDADPCLLIRLADGRLVAYSQKCTHLSCAVIPDPEKGIIYCPCHEGCFDLEHGRPLAGPPRRPLALIRLEIAGDGSIYATGVEERTT
jgi:nitrite reductase/ring-hydroxylating ferredoxin subunit